MHIQPGLIDPAKMILATTTAAAANLAGAKSVCGLGKTGLVTSRLCA